MSKKEIAIKLRIYYLITFSCLNGELLLYDKILSCGMIVQLFTWIPTV